MSEDHLANKSQPPAQPDAEYELIYATVSETAQGRRFLEEYARRCRPSETEMALAAVERMQAAIRAGEAGGQLDLLHEMAGMAQAIARLRAEIMAIKAPAGGALDATEELDSIVHVAESATSRILAATEQMQEIAWTLRESGANNALCDDLDAQANEIYTACTFQDLTGQRTRKMIQLLRYLEDRINAAVAGERPAADDDSVFADAPAQTADAAMQPQATAHDDRQDATLEDISRVMLALEPMMAFHQSSDDEPIEQPDVNIETPAPDDARPELSVAEAVMAEADAARDLAEWAVEPKAPAEPKPAEDVAATADWVVEDPLAPRPDSEPAWMILRRMETELDAQEEAEAHAEATNFTPAPILPVPEVPVMAEPVVRPPSSFMPEPALFVAEAMAQLEHSLRPAVMPPPELTFRTGFPTPDPLVALQAAMEADEMKLAQPGEDTDALNPPQETEVPQPAETSELMQRAAAVVIDRAPAEVEEVVAPAASDTDDFLFAPEEPGQHPVPTQFTPETGPQEMQQAAVEETQAASAAQAIAPEPEWEGGTYPHPALVTPQVLDEPAPQAEVQHPAPQPRATPSGHDPLAPLRALSEAQKIALFS